MMSFVFMRIAQALSFYRNRHYSRSHMRLLLRVSYFPVYMCVIRQSAFRSLTTMQG